MQAAVIRPCSTSSPDELSAVKAEGGLTEESGHELVAVDLVYPPSHGSVALPRELLAGLLGHDCILWRQDESKGFVITQQRRSDSGSKSHKLIQPTVFFILWRNECQKINYPTWQLCLLWLYGDTTSWFYDPDLDRFKALICGLFLTEHLLYTTHRG